MYVRDGTYNEAVSIGVSGTVSNRITIAADDGHNPIIDGTGLSGGVNHNGAVLLAGLAIINQSYVTIEGFEIQYFTGSGGNFPSGIWVRGACKEITVQSNTVHDIVTESDEGAHGMAFYGTNVVPMETLVVDGNIVYDCVLGWSEALVVNGNVRGFIVSNNYVHDVDNIAFDFIGYEEECSACASDSASADDVDRARQGVVTQNTARNIDTLSNPAYGGDRSAAGFYVDGGRDIVIERNIVDSANLGIELASEHNGLKTESITVRNNLIYHCHVAGIATGGYEAGVDNNPGDADGKGFAEDCVISNNTLYKNTSDSWAEAEILLQNRNINNTYKNNIIYADDGGGGYRTIGDDSGGGDAANVGNTFDYNLHYMTDSGDSQVAANYDAFGANSIEQDPLFNNAAADDYSSTASSPGNDRGTTSGLTTSDCDLDGLIRIFNSIIDLGAYEYGASTCNFASWIEKYYPALSGSDASETADPDQDGTSNLIEYALESDPTNNDTTLSPSISINGSALDFSYRGMQASLSYQVQTNTDLVSSWSNYGSAVVGDMTTHIVSIPFSMMVDGKIFVRLSVSE